jgi:peptide deformylase
MINNKLIIYNPFKKNDLNNIILKTKQEEKDYSSQKKRYLVAENLKYFSDLHDGVGLASNQINLNERAFLSNKVTYFNPKIIDFFGERDHYFTEGCLSFLGVNINTARFQKIKISYTSINGETIIKNLEDFDAIVFQHELDHVDGLIMPVRAKSKLTEKRFWDKYKKTHKIHFKK